MPPAIQSRPREPVVFILGGNSESESREDRQSDNSSTPSDLLETMEESPRLRKIRSVPNLQSLFHPLDWIYDGRDWDKSDFRKRMNPATLRRLLFGEAEYDSFRDWFFETWKEYNGDPWSLTREQVDEIIDLTRQRTREVLSRRMSEGGGEAIRESWLLFASEELINIHFRHTSGLRPSPAGSLDGAWNNDLDSAIDRRFRESADAPFLTRERWLRQQLGLPVRPRRDSAPSTGSSHSASRASQEEEDDEWVWSPAVPETFEDGEWDAEVVRDELADEEDRVGEESVGAVARELLTQALRRLWEDLSR